MASIFTPARPTTINRSGNHKTHKNSKPAINFANRYQEDVNLFTQPQTKSEQNGCFAVEFAMMSFDKFGSVRELVGRRLSKG
jgi:hypothetical protein